MSASPPPQQNSLLVEDQHRRKKAEFSALVCEFIVHKEIGFFKNMKHEGTLRSIVHAYTHARASGPVENECQHLSLLVPFCVMWRAALKSLFIEKGPGLRSSCLSRTSSVKGAPLNETQSSLVPGAKKLSTQKDKRSASNFSEHLMSPMYSRDTTFKALLSFLKLATAPQQLVTLNQIRIRPDNSQHQMLKNSKDFDPNNQRFSDQYIPPPNILGHECIGASIAW